MEIGVSTACFYPLETELALETLGKMGVRMVEIFSNAPSELEPAFVQKLKSIVDYYGMRVVAVHPFTSGFEPFTFFSGYKRRFYDGMRDYETFYRAACMLGANIVELHGDRAEGSLPDEEYFGRFRQMHLHAREFGVILAQENVARCKSRSSDFIRRMRLSLGDDVRFLLDVKQVVRAGERMEDMVSAMGGQIVHLHLSDSRGSAQDCLPPGEGHFDFKSFFTAVKQTGFRGNGVIELYRDNYRNNQELFESYRWLQKIFAAK